MNRVLRASIPIIALAGLAGLAGCSHNCVPEGWYGAHSVPAPQQPPGTPAIAHSSDFDIPGSAPSGKPTRAQACLVYPPDALSPAPASATAGRAH